ncbi:hypothetical protein FUA23_14155 [Neolewinella aurantiaca]|uniref:Uncharacterized protein n=1 Tax=Neolewinella aurantiaca TaxID=2602767 RepID=A0A5C7FT87_9BACT|nr:hypothetical protein [Neolewinella aurantiaca]TXF88605.1 hypothetical protein FUA23_14155 [Neolewinella aurantiaca]
MKLYFTLFGLLLSVATISAAESDALSTFSAPAAAATQIDSLPGGRHKVSSYRNGSSIEFTVEDHEIKSLKVDGEEVPASKYDQYMDRVENLLGTGTDNQHIGSGMGMFSDEESLQKMEEHFEKLGESFELRFENLGEDFERMGERLGESIERMFEFDGNGNTMRFEFRGDDGSWFIDSTGIDESFEWHSNGMDPKGLNQDIPTGEHHQAEEEIREMETMIEQLERKKARMKADLERQERDIELQQRDMERQERSAARELRSIERQEMRMERREASYEVLVEQLQREGLIEGNDLLRKLSVDAQKLKVNGKKVSEEGHARFLELYEQQTGRAINGKTSISITMD